jgi:hypothetical protein
MPRFKLEEWVIIVVMVILSTPKTAQPKSWLAGLGRKRRSVDEDGGGMMRFKCEDLIERVIIVVISTFEMPQPNSWLTGLGRKRKSVREGGR